MSTYSQDESSPTDSRPVELFDFVFAAASYHYTSYSRDFTYLGTPYTATTVRRGSIAVVNAQEVPENTVELPVADPVVQAYAGVGVPPQKLLITVRRLQQTSGGVVGLFTGQVKECRIRGRNAALVVSQITEDPMSLVVPSVVLSRLCNHVLYDSLCQVLRSANQVVTTIASISSDRRTIGVSSIGGFSNPTDFVFGEMLHSGINERRTIVSQSSLSMTLDVALPTTVHVGDAITIFRGCDHVIKTCRDKHTNVPNFGGHPHIVNSNFSYIDFRVG